MRVHRPRATRRWAPRTACWLRYFFDRFDNTGVLNPTNLLTYTDQASIQLSQRAHRRDAHVLSDTLLNNFILSYQIEDSSRGPVAGALNVNDLGVNIWQPAFKQINQIIRLRGTSSPSATIPAATFRRANYTLGRRYPLGTRQAHLGFGFHGETRQGRCRQPVQQPGSFSFNSSTTGDALRQLPARRPDFLPAGLRSVLQQPQQVHGLLRAGQLEGNPPPHAQLRPALRALSPSMRSSAAWACSARQREAAGQSPRRIPTAPLACCSPATQAFVDGHGPTRLHALHAARRIRV